MTNERTLEAEKQNGVHLLGIRDEREGYTVHAQDDTVWVERIKAHGLIVGFDEYAEFECTGFEINGGTINLLFTDG